MCIAVEGEGNQPPEKYKPLNKKEAGMGKRRADEKFLCVNEIKNATS